MKKILLPLAILLFAGLANLASAQKIGHVNSQEILAAMPQRDSIAAALQAEVTQMETMLAEMSAEFEGKYNEYLEKSATWSDLVRRDKEAELQSLQSRIQSFQVDAQEQIGASEERMLQPLLDRAQAAIDRVAAEKKLTYVLDLSMGVVIFVDEATAIDITPEVKLALGIR